MNERLEAIKGNMIYAETPGELTVMPDSWIVTEGGIIREYSASCRKGMRQRRRRTTAI